MQNKAQQNIKQSRRNCEMKQQFLWAVTFIVTEKQNKLLWWRHNKL